MVGKNKKAVRPGYKLTDMGVIPEEWSIQAIGDFSKVVRWASPRPAWDPRFFHGDFIPWLTVGSLTSISENQITVRTTETFLTENGANFSRRLWSGTVIIANSGATLGVAKLLWLDCCANDGVAALLNLQSNVCAEFVVRFINSQTNRLRDIVAPWNGQPNLNTELIANITVPMPDFTEQSAIAKVLSDTDALIASLDALIEKKRAIKLGAMQELLTGKRRLPGLGGEWVVEKLWNVVDIKKWQLITESSRRDGLIPVIAWGKLPAYFHDMANRRWKTITISWSGASAWYVWFWNTPIFASDCSTINESGTYSIEFVYYWLSLKQEEVYHAQTWWAQPHIHPKDLNPMRTYWPKSVFEQSAIAQVLSDMDAEISALEAKRDKYKAIKQGMMQELLTGNIRLVWAK